MLTTILAANPDLGGVYGVNDSMALGAVDVAKEKGLIGKLVIFGNDGETAALEVHRGGRADRHAVYRRLSSRAGLPRRRRRCWRPAAFRPTAFAQQGHLLMPYVIATKDNVGSIQPSQRW